MEESLKKKIMVYLAGALLFLAGAVGILRFVVGGERIPGFVLRASG